MPTLVLFVAQALNYAGTLLILLPLLKAIMVHLSYYRSLTTEVRTVLDKLRSMPIGASREPDTIRLAAEFLSQRPSIDSGRLYPLEIAIITLGIAFIVAGGGIELYERASAVSFASLSLTAGLR